MEAIEIDKMTENAIPTSVAVVDRRGKAGVILEKWSVINHTKQCLWVDLGNGSKISIATKSYGPAAGNNINLPCWSARVPRIFAHAAQGRAVYTISLTIRGQEKNILKIWYILVPPG